MTVPDGITLRPIDHEADLGVVSALYEACDIADVGHRDHQDDWIVQAWKAPAFAGAWVAERDGQVVAYLELEWREGTRGVESFLPVLPSERSGTLRAALLEMVETEASAMVPDLAWVRAVGTATDPTFAEACRSAGFEHVRTFWHMERSIAPPPDPAPLPPDVAIRTSTGPEDDPLLHAIIESAFVDHFGNEPQSLASWQAENADILQDRDLILIASVDGVPAGVLTSFVPSGIGWIGELGVRSEFRGRGVGRALLEAAFVALASRGASIARLNVDGANETGATRLYASVGMDVRREFLLFEKPMRSGE